MTRIPRPLSSVRSWHAIKQPTEPSIRTPFVLPAALALLAAPSLTHHGWGSYDAGHPITVARPIVTSKFENPHAAPEIPFGRGRTFERAVYEIVARRAVEALSPGAPLPHRAAVAGWLSLVIWIAVASCGRSIAYFESLPAKRRGWRRADDLNKVLVVTGGTIT
jgi:hypothetical protein